MTRDEAIEHIAAVMNDWWPELEWSPARVAEQFRLLEERCTFESNVFEMWYSKFALDVLQQASLVQ